MGDGLARRPDTCRLGGSGARGRRLAFGVLVGVCVFKEPNGRAYASSRRCKHRHCGVVITLVGELDLASAPDLADAKGGAASSGAEIVIVDLRGIEFMGSTGISVLVNSHHAAAQSGYRVAVVKGSRQVDRMLSLTGLDEQLTLLDAPEECDTGPSGNPDGPVPFQCSSLGSTLPGDAPEEAGLAVRTR
ncbi:MAG: anti-sigma factor antagonist [Solirubrobacteraceae bacterium]